MLHETSGMHHLHRRQIIHQKHEEYPHPDKTKRIMDKLVYAASIFAPIMTLPQVMIIWIDKNAQGISVVSWIAYMLCALIWLMYGFLHKEKPIIIMNLLWIVLDLLVIIGVMVYA
ncbi:MAG: hypothetical protein KJ583_03595 [Nanoarchaeota archaeon]|nr:hypothetical protein [Nanoarchaeota archaeon]MBU1269784.1 hypothetical protein [Nanoarchaeota archaeon]MBU1604376.1 hypothetical protein [Nanoarchaeota archaeon]MBU2443639.1 hypothetical protein [Nanoarchaeota archaeon]